MIAMLKFLTMHSSTELNKSATTLLQNSIQQLLEECNARQPPPNNQLLQDLLAAANDANGRLQALETIANERRQAPENSNPGNSNPEDGNPEDENDVEISNTGSIGI